MIPDPTLRPTNDRADANEGTPPRRRPIAKIVLSLVTVACLASTAVLATGATLNDQVTMAQITVTGGSLDVDANGDASDSGVAWSGTFDVSNMAPGDVETAVVSVDNVGSLPFTLTASIAGTDASGCFGVYFRETAVDAGTGASAHPVNLASMGTGTADGAVVALSSSPTGSDLPDNGADLEWETDDAKTYQLSIRMRDACSTNAASGTVDVTIDAAQA